MEALEQDLPCWQSLVASGTIRRLSHFDMTSSARFGAYLGLALEHDQLADGPLVCAALRVYPPDRSVQFRVGVLSFASDGLLTHSPFRPQPGEVREIRRIGERLNSSSLTFIGGPELDHGLVWEQGSIDMQTLSPDVVCGKKLAESAPQGDGERMLRTWIEDSADLLSRTEMNARRLDDGLPPWSVLWPFGHGLRPRVPNLTLERHETTFVQSSQILMEGFLAEKTLRVSRSLTILDSLEPFMQEAHTDEMNWFVREWDDNFCKPLLDHIRLDSDSRATFVFPSLAGDFGLILSATGRLKQTSSLPYDARSLDDGKIPMVHLHEACLEALTCEN
jgi:hypothetical protein